MDFSTFFRTTNVGTGLGTGFAGIPIGLALTLIHLVSIPVTNTLSAAAFSRAWW